MSQMIIAASIVIPVVLWYCHCRWHCYHHYDYWNSISDYQQ